MSRCTKLLITALFLVLLGIPTIHVALTWHLRNPLRFRILRVELPPEPSQDGYFMVARMEMEVINTSSTPVTLWAVNLHREKGDTIPGVGSVQSETGTAVEGRIDEEQMLSGNGRFHFSGGLGWPKDTSLDHNNLRVEYKFATRTKLELWEMYWSLCELLPEAWHASMPHPNLSQGVAPLEPER